uniref:Methyltranfer_dom domain-containing protein n=1 Tax=Bursaphelenchus xylophilus TaxID=6326 RepID=A0A1I7SBT9_BURXY
MLAVQALNRFVHAIEEGAAPSEFYEDIQQAFEMVRRENERISPRLVEKICNYFPGDIGSLNSKALLFDQEGLIIQSVCTYTEILRSTDGQVDVRNDLENIRTHFFDQWHWIMANDRRRNRAFFEGIREILGIFKENSMESGSKVNILDLGCGSGLLTVMAAKIAKEIGMDTKFISVDSSRTFGDLAKITCQENEVESEVRTVDSREMESPSEAINLVISETLDCAIFGEGICSSLLDVHRRMRSPGEFRVVPQTAKLFVQLISSATIKKSHYRDMGDYCLISQETYRNSPAPQQAPYDCERMEKIEYQPLSEGVPVIDINFEDPKQLEAVVGNAVNGEFTVTTTEEGEATALMAWFL